MIRQTPVTKMTEPPFQDVVLNGPLLSAVWQRFIRVIADLLRPLGEERTFELENSLAQAKPIPGLEFNKTNVSHAIVEYCVQRITENPAGQNLIESGVMVLTYRPMADTWILSFMSENLPNDSGVTFTVNAAGQIFYTSSNLTGVPAISRVFWRARTLGGKSATYSTLGGR